MHKEIECFRNEITKHNSEFSKLGYSLIAEKVFNPEKLEYVYYEIKYSNNNNNKLITFNLHPSTNLLCKNQIVAYITFNSMSFGISEYLAYQKLHRKIKSEDIEPYRFIFASDNLKTSISSRLTNIFDLFSSELKKYLTTDEWIHIPIHDPRDDY